VADNGADEPAQERAPLVHLLRWRDVTTRCVWLACGREGLNRKDQCGISMDRPMVSVDREELRAPIEPSARPRN
jgi:hypothetical protein